jgi:hypothetical protein
MHLQYLSLEAYDRSPTAANQKGEGLMRHDVPLVQHRQRGRVFLLALAAAVGAGLLAASSAGGGQAGFGCAPAFDLGALTFSESLNLPRIQAGLAAGAFTTSDLEALFDGIDHNGDGAICFQDLGALNGGAGIWEFFYNGVDNNASVPGS